MQITGPCPELWIQQVWGWPKSAFRTHSEVAHRRSIALSPPRLNQPFTCVTLSSPEDLSEVDVFISKPGTPTTTNYGLKQSLNPVSYVNTSEQCGAWAPPQPPAPTQTNVSSRACWKTVFGSVQITRIFLCLTQATVRSGLFSCKKHSFLYCAFTERYFSTVLMQLLDTQRTSGCPPDPTWPRDTALSYLPRSLLTPTPRPLPSASFLLTASSGLAHGSSVGFP